MSLCLYLSWANGISYGSIVKSSGASFKYGINLWEVKIKVFRIFSKRNGFQEFNFRLVFAPSIRMTYSFCLSLIAVLVSETLGYTLAWCS